MEKKVQRRPYKVFEQQAETCRKEWQRFLPWYQQMIDQAAEIGLSLNHELIADLVNFRGRETVQILTANATEQAKKTGITDPQIIKSLIGNPSERIHPLLKTAEMINHVWKTAFVPEPLRGSLSSNYLTIDKGKALLTDESFEQIKAEYFTAYVETPVQEQVLELAQKIEPALNELYQVLTGFYPHIGIESIFKYDDQSGKFELDPYMLTLVNPEKK